MARQFLQIPGPTNIPDSILRELSRPAINHRGTEFATVLHQITEGLQYVLQSENDVLLFPSSGSGTLEAAIVNMFSPGDKVLAFNMGVFAKRFGQIAEHFSLEVCWTDVPWGQPLEPQVLEAVILRNPDINGVLLTQSETSTAILNDIPALQRVIRAKCPGALILVDAVSSLAISDLPVDQLDLDIVVAGSQKGLMLPGGLGIVAVSERAWRAHESATLPRWYWDFAPLKARMVQGRMVYTPAIAHFFGLIESLRLIQAEGLPQVFKRHRRNARALQQGILALGLDLLVENPHYRSDAVTAVKLPVTLAFPQLAQDLEHLNITIGGGLQELEGKIFRIGHLGMLHEVEVLAIIGGLEMALSQQSYPFELGRGVAGVARYYLEH